MRIDPREQALLKTLVERYIAEGQPVGSRVLSKLSNLDLSPATIRNIMADLEEMGFVASPHTSAGRIPTPRGFRMFVDTLLTADKTDKDMPLDSEIRLPSQIGQPQKIISDAAQMLSSLTQFAGVVMAPQHESAFSQIEFLRLSEKRILLVIHSDLSKLMQTAIDAGDETLAEHNDEVVIAGKKNLLNVNDFAYDLSSLKRLFNMFEQKTELMQLLDISSRASGIQIYIGGDSQLVPTPDISVVTAPYQVNEQFVGTLGVIGPTRMAYQKVINIVDVTSRLLSNALSQSSLKEESSNKP